MKQTGSLFSQSNPMTAAKTTYAIGTPSQIFPLHCADVVRLALFFIIPIYARTCMSPSVSSVLGHIYTVGSTGVCVVHFSRGSVKLHHVGDVVYTLLVSGLPKWSKSISILGCLTPEMEGWRGGVFYYAFAARQSAGLLPLLYGSDVEVGSVSPRFYYQSAYSDRHLSPISETFILVAVFA
jgi:hypothetical protein